jgi:hypothetical protein
VDEIKYTSIELLWTDFKLYPEFQQIIHTPECHSYVCQCWGPTWHLDKLYLGWWKLLNCLLFILWISEFVVNWFLLMSTKSNKESTYWEGKGNIFNFLSVYMILSFFLLPIIIRVISIIILIWKSLCLCVETGAVMLRVRVHVRRTVHTCSGRIRTSLWCDRQIPTSLRTSPEQNIVTSFVMMFCSVFCYKCGRALRRPCQSVLLRSMNASCSSELLVAHISKNFSACNETGIFTFVFARPCHCGRSAELKNPCEI